MRREIMFPSTCVFCERETRLNEKKIGTHIIATKYDNNAIAFVRLWDYAKFGGSRAKY